MLAKNFPSAAKDKAMLYSDGQKIELGDRIDLDAMAGTIVVIIEDRLAADGFLVDDWTYLESGILVLTEAAGLMYYAADVCAGVELIARRSPDVRR